MRIAWLFYFFFVFLLFSRFYDFFFVLLILKILHKNEILFGRSTDQFWSLESVLIFINPKVSFLIKNLKQQKDQPQKTHIEYYTKDYDLNFMQSYLSKV